MNPEIQSVLAELKGALPGFDAKFDALQKQIDDFQIRRSYPGGGGHGGVDPIRKAMEGNEDVLALMGGRRKSAIIKITDLPLDLKTTITSGAVGSETSGVLRHERVENVVTLAQRKHFMRDVLDGKPTTASAIDFVKELAFTNAASPQVEASAKGESALTFTTEVAPVRTIAHWIPASKQVLDDFEALLRTIRMKLIFGYLIEEDRNILLGDGTGQNLTGLATAATAFDTSLSGSGAWTKQDLLRRVIQQIERGDEVVPSWFVIHPDDHASIDLQKDTAGNYINGSPSSLSAPVMWSRPIVVSTAIGSGKFLAGSGAAADLRIRQEISVEISTEHSDFFTRNLIAIRCEGRVALPIYRPGALVYGSFNTSPAS